MNYLTPYLNCIILASVAYPSGFSYSLYNIWKGSRPTISTSLLIVLVLPFALVVPAVWALSPATILVRSTTIPQLVLAAVLAPITILLEYGINAFAVYRVTGVLPRRIAVEGFWNVNFSPVDHLLLGLTVFGEEIFYRGIWLGTLLSCGVAAPLALAISSAAYAINHFYAGGMPVLSKLASGLVYGMLYLFGGQSIWLPVVTHILQNLVLFKLPRESHA